MLKPVPPSAGVIKTVEDARERLRRMGIDVPAPSPAGDKEMKKGFSRDADGNLIKDYDDDE